jgi:hypothetical protein
MKCHNCVAYLYEIQNSKALSFKLQNEFSPVQSMNIMLNIGATKKCLALEAVTNMTDFQQYISICNEQQLTFLLLENT